MLGEKIVLNALQYIGLKAVYGPKNESKILEFWRKIGFNNIVDDETPWCSTFIMAIFADLKIEYNANPAARSWLNTGEKVLEPRLGDICIFWRESLESWKGHVGIYVNESALNYYILGGNQDGSVSISPFPKSKLLGARRFSERKF
jgi:uncharacterized protein (TIGR02594 family)